MTLINGPSKGRVSKTPLASDKSNYLTHYSERQPSLLPRMLYKVIIAASIF
jgi:hypothetical protein